MILVGDIAFHMVEKLLRCRPNEDVVISSPGGDIEAARALYDLIHLTGRRTVAVGTCASCAFDIWLAGVERYATPNCAFLLHGGRYSAAGSKTSRALIAAQTDIADWEALIFRRLASLAPEVDWPKLGEEGGTFFNLDTLRLMAPGVVTEVISEQTFKSSKSRVKIFQAGRDAAGGVEAEEGKK